MSGKIDVIAFPGPVICAECGYPIHFEHLEKRAHRVEGQCRHEGCSRDGKRFWLTGQIYDCEPVKDI